MQLKANELRETTESQESSARSNLTFSSQSKSKAAKRTRPDFGSAAKPKSDQKNKVIVK